MAVLVPDYDKAIGFFTAALGFDLLEDTDLGNGKRWVRVGPSGAQTAFLLARAVDEQKAAIGRQGGGRVWLFLQSSDFQTDYTRMLSKGVHFEEPPRQEPYGTVAVFQDPWGNRWDLIEFNDKG